MGIDIPALCYHDAVSPYGACRLCLVEVTLRGRTRIVTSCTYPAEEGLEVRTDTERVLRLRRGVAELLLARCPEVEAVRRIARQLGVEKPRFTVEETDDCILCGLCTRVCAEVIGAAGIGFARRGIEREVTTPWSDRSEACIGCGACVAVCPTGAVLERDRGWKRVYERWHTELELARCRECGRAFAPVKLLEEVRRRLGLDEDFVALCPECRRRALGERLKLAGAAAS